MLTQATRLLVIDAGVCAYDEALKLQMKLHQRCLQSEGREAFLIKVEHPPVITMGKNASELNLLLSREELRNAGVAVFPTERGGEATAHMPGQMVVYPILPLTQLAMSPRRYIEILEQTVIDLLKLYDIEAGRSKIYPGVWAGDAKICAIGVRIKQRVSMHGLALNVSNSLDLFRKIIPCGIQGKGVTSMSILSGNHQELIAVWEKYKTIFARELALPFSDTTLPDLLDA